MSEQEVDEYLAVLDEPKRATLEQLRRTILEIVPDAEQCISYGMPAFKLDGKAVAGFAAFKHHLSYFPHSSAVLTELADELEPSRSTLRSRRRWSRSSSPCAAGKSQPRSGGRSGTSFGIPPRRVDFGG